MKVKQGVKNSRYFFWLDSARLRDAMCSETGVFNDKDTSSRNMYITI